jgi:hypothetical protein
MIGVGLVITDTGGSGWRWTGSGGISGGSGGSGMCSTVIGRGRSKIGMSIFDKASAVIAAACAATTTSRLVGLKPFCS